jgi:radical SAM protein with 4Fe4S-binding SPASM domain
MSKMGVASNVWERLSYSVEEFFEFWKTGVEYAYKNNIKEYSSYLLLQKILQRKDPNFLDLMSPCGGAIGHMAYNFNGDIYTCDDGRMINDNTFKLGTVYENSFDEIIHSFKVQNFVCFSTNDKPPCMSCAYQPFCGICPVHNYATTGNLFPDESPDNRCRILKLQFDYLFEKIIGEDELFKKTIDLLKEQA